MGVHIFWDSRADVGFARPVTEELSTVLNMPLSRIDNGTFPLDGYDPVRKQYDALQILDKLDLFRSRHPELFKPADVSDEFFKNNSRVYEKVLLITAGDLYVDRNSFVYGLAYPRLGVAVVSITRLQNEYYGRHSDDSAAIKRIVTECSHEIGHLYGLEHCDNPNCIMYCPNNLDDLERKETYFCGRCRMLLDTAIQGGPTC